MGRRDAHVLVEVLDVLALLLELLLDGEEPAGIALAGLSGSQLDGLLHLGGGVEGAWAFIRTWPSLPGGCRAPRRRPRAW